MVLVKIAAILVFVFAALSFIKPHYWHPFMPNGWTGVLTGGSIIFFTYIGFDSVSTAAEECKQSAARYAVRDSRDADGVHGSLWRRGDYAQRHCAVASDDGRCGAGGERAKEAVAHARRRHRLHWVRLFVLVGALMGMISSILVFQLGQARVWFAMSREGCCPGLRQIHALPHAGRLDLGGGICGGIPAGLFDIGTVSEPLEHRHAVRVRAGLDRAC